MPIGIRAECLREADDAGAQPRRDLRDQIRILGQTGRTFGTGEQLGRRASGFDLDRDRRGRRREISGPVRAARQRR